MSKRPPKLTARPSRADFLVITGLSGPRPSTPANDTGAGQGQRR